MQNEEFRYSFDRFVRVYFITTSKRQLSAISLPVGTCERRHLVKPLPQPGIRIGILLLSYFCRRRRAEGIDRRRDLAQDCRKPCCSTDLKASSRSDLPLTCNHKNPQKASQRRAVVFWRGEEPKNEQRIRCNSVTAHKMRRHDLAGKTTPKHAKHKKPDQKTGVGGWETQGRKE
jgi:hypothetical protein